MDSNIRKNPSARTNKFLSSLKAIVTRKSKDDNAVVNDNHPYSHRDGKPYMSQPVLALSHPIQSDIDADDASDHSDRSSPSTINKYPQLPHARAVSTGGLSFHDVMVKAQHNRHTSVTTTIETSRPSVPNSLRPGSLTGLPPPSTLSKGSEAFVPNSSKPGEIRGLVKPSLLKPSRPKTPVSKLLPPIPTIPLSLSYSSSEGDTITSSVQVATGTPNPYMSADRPVLITYSSTPTLPATVTGDRHNGVRSAERANNIPPVLEGDFSTERVYPKLTVNTMLDIKCNDATNNSSTINTASSQQPNFTPIQPRRTVSSAPRLSLPPANYRFSLNLVDGYSARLSPSVILRPPPLPLLNLPMLSGSTGPASSRRSKRAGLMSMPALPRHGSTMARDEEFDDVEEGEDGEDGDQEDGDGVDDDDHISPDSAPLEDEVESGYNSTSDTIHSGPSGSRSPSTCSYETPQARSSTPDEGPGYFGDLSKPAEKRFSRSPYLPPVDMSRIDMSFLDAPPLDIKGKGKSRGSTEDAGRTPIATKKPNRHGSTTPTAFGMGFFIPEETATDTWAPSSPMIKGTSPIQTPRPGDHFNLPPLPLPPSPCPILPTSSTDNRLPVPMDTTTQFLRMHKRASRSLVDIHALEKKEKVEQMVREEENSAEEERKRRIKSMRMSMKFAADGGTFSDPRLEDGDGQLKASSPTGLSRRSHFAPNWVSDGIKNDGKDGPIKASGDASSAAANLKKTDNRISMAPAYDTIIPLRRRRSMPTFNSASTPPPPYPDLFPGQSFGVKLNQIQPRDDEGQEKLPAYSNSIYLKAIMPRKIEFSQPGVQAKDRKWKRVLCVLEGTSFKVYKPPGISAIEGWWENTVGVGDMAVQITTTSSFSSRGGGAGNTDITGEGKGHLERERMREAMLRSRLDDAILSIQGPPIPFGSSNLSSATTRSGDHASSTSTTGVRPVTKSALNLAVNLLKPSSRSHGRTISDAGQPSNTLSVHRSPRPSLNMPRDGSATPTPTVASTNTNTSASLSRSSSPMFASSSSLLTTPAPSHRSTTSTSSIGGSGGSATSRPVTNSINANYPPSFSSSKGKKKAEDSDLEPDPNSLIKKYTMQKAECGLGSDYLKRKHVIRVRLEGEQFLLQAKDVDSVIAWIEGLQSAANVAMDLDERVMPRGPLFPRRRRRRRAGDATGVQPATLRTSTANIPLDALQLAAPLVF